MLATINKRKEENSPEGSTDNQQIAFVGIESSSAHTVADSFSLVKEYDEDFHYKPADPSLLNDDGTPKRMPADAEEYGYVNTDGQSKSKDNIFP